MPKTIPEPSISISIPAFAISDQTAAIKARRIIEQIKGYATLENWHKRNATLGLKVGISNTRAWRIILGLPRTRKDAMGFWFDRKGNQMDRPDEKRTHEVALLMLSSNAVQSVTGTELDDGLYLSLVCYNRTGVLQRQRTHALNTEGAVLSVTFHVLQRIIQRGYGLSPGGELTYRGLLTCLVDVWSLAVEASERAPGEKVVIDYQGGRFVIQWPSKEKPMILVTLLPA